MPQTDAQVYVLVFILPDCRFQPGDWARGVITVTSRAVGRASLHVQVQVQGSHDGNMPTSFPTSTHTVELPMFNMR